MSYQFEDDSALEELLNQQLDRRKQQPKPLQQSTAARPSTAMTNSSVNQPPLQQQPSRPLVLSASSGNRKTSLENIERQAPKSKLSSWLSGKQTQGDKLDQRPDEIMTFVPSKINKQTESKGNHTTEIQEIDLSLFDEDELQEMSKQRLIQLIMNQIQDVVKDLHRVASINSASQVEQLKTELEVERRRVQSLETTQVDKMKLEQQKWTQINEQLERRLSFSENEMKRLLDGQREHLLKIDQQHERDLQKLIEYYDLKIKDNKEQFDELLKRRDEIHQIEMDSRLRVDCNLNKLDTIQTEWTKSIETTIGQLEKHFKSVQSLLDKQTIQVNGTNVNLLEKTKHLNDHYGKFEQCNIRVSELADYLNSLMPKVTRLQEQNESIYQVTCEKLEEFNKRSDLLSQREQEIEKIKLDLLKAKDKLNEDRLKLALDMNRVELKEASLNESLQSNRELEVKLNEQKSQQLERDIQLHSMRSNLDIKANELREQNYDLHRMRKNLTNQREDLIKSQKELETKNRSIEGHSSKLEANSKKLYLFRMQVNRELDQLRRLQRSLICSLCLSRLFSSSNKAILRDKRKPRGELNDNREHFKLDINGDANDDDDHHHLWTPTEVTNKTIGRFNPRTGSIGQLEATKLPPELDTLKEQAERDKRRVIGESRFVEMISTTN